MPKYKLPPLVFYETHSDNSVMTFIIDHLDYFQKAGYRAICFELEAGQSLEVTIKQISTALPPFIHKLSQINDKDKDYESMVTQLRAIGGKQLFFLSIKDTSFIFRGIDMPVMEQMKKGLDSPERNKLLSTNIIKTAEEFDGGIIVITGLGHYSLQHFISKLDPDHADQYLWFHIHNPVYETRARQELVQNYQKEGYNKYFPLGISIFQSSDEQLPGRVKEAISKNCYAYEPEDLNTSTAMILKTIIGSDVSAHLRSDGEHYVDALLPLGKAAKSHNSSPTQFLSDLSKTLKNIQYEVQELREPTSKEKETFVIIRNINTREVAEDITKLKPKT